MVKLRRALMVLAGPYVATLAVAWLMVLLVLGTLAQANMGLYAAQQKYFSAVILWLGWLPTPGGAATMGLLTLGLSLKLLLHPWRLARLGSLLAHIAVWLLLVGGFATALVSTEGYIRVAEGQTSAVLHSYHTPALAVLSASGTTLLTYPLSALKTGARLPIGDETLLVEAYYPNTELTPRATAVDDGLTIGLRRFMAMTLKAPEADDERNRPGLLFTKLNAQGNGQGNGLGQPLARLALFQHQPVAQPVTYAAYPSATLVLRPAQTALPFSVKLIRFEQEYYPGTSVPRHYASAVTIVSPASGEWPAYIRMNAPLRYAGHTLYQASFINAEVGAAGAMGPQISILAVVKNQGYLIPYAASILLCLGLLLHLWLRWRKALVVVVALLPLLSGVGHAQPLGFSTFAQLPIQHAGRIKPLQTYAEVTLKALSGNTSLPRLPAVPWLAEVVFNPSAAMQRPLFTLPSLALTERLKLPRRTPRRYSYAEVVPALQPLFTNLQTIAQQPANQRDALDAQLLTLADQVQQFYLLAATGPNVASPFTVHPPRLAESMWLPPMAAPATPYRATWQALAVAYVRQDATLWQTANQAAWRQAGKLPGVRAGALRAEVALRALHPFALATGLFGLAAGLLAWPRGRRLAPWPLVAGLGVAAAAVVARSYILQRPPVGTLYESIVFVGLVAVAVALFAAYKNTAQRLAWLVLAAATGLGLQLLGLRYAAGSADTLGVLTAVLDTNFWLATHVLIITAGYGLAVVAGGWAVGMLGLQVWQGKGPTPLALRSLNLLLLAALVWVATGTLLGGVWADQSWGRFWGWDPKENGALLLTLWLVWLLHARLAGLLGKLGLVAGAALTPSVVAVAWFGVNMLGVGLHSYGFMPAAMLGLTLFMGVNLLGVVALAIVAYRGRANAHG